MEEYHDTALDGYVYKMDPPAGDTVTSGDTVTLYVSRGQKVEYVSVPKSATKIDFTVSGGPDYEPPKAESETEEVTETPVEGDNGDAA